MWMAVIYKTVRKTRNAGCRQAGNKFKRRKEMEQAKLRELISQMTLEEKAGMCSGQDFWHTKAVERLGIPAYMVSDDRTDCASRMRKPTISV